MSKELWNGMTQVERAFNYLRWNGSLQPLEALNELGIYRLSAVIFELRKTVDINMEITPVKNRFGETCHVARYTLEYPDDYPKD